MWPEFDLSVSLSLSQCKECSHFETGGKRVPGHMIKANKKVSKQQLSNSTPALDVLCFLFNYKMLFFKIFLVERFGEEGGWGGGW